MLFLFKQRCKGQAILSLWKELNWEAISPSGTSHFFYDFILQSDTHWDQEDSWKSFCTTCSGTNLRFSDHVLSMFPIILGFS